jgi:hypothetical protein
VAFFIMSVSNKELLGVSGFLSVSLFLCLLSWIHDSTFVSLKRAVEVSGAAARPGVYWVDLADPMEVHVPEAKGLEVSRGRLVVPAQDEIVVIVEGAVRKPGPCILPQGATRSDLESYGEGADPSWFKKKGQLRNGAHVRVPTKRLR